MGDAQGFSLHPFAVDGPTEPNNAWVCHFTGFSQPSWLSPVDMSSGLGGVECELRAHADLAELTVKDVAALLRVLKYLVSL